MRKKLTIERLRHLLNYNQETGLFTRRVGVRGYAAGSSVGHQRSDGRKQISVDWGRYLASRLAWFYTKGKWPKNEIDHINGDYSDDRICNLREATRSQNLMNTRIRSDNTTGYKGVHWSKEKKKWKSVIHLSSGPKHLGYFDDPETAYGAYCKMATQHFAEYARLK